MIKTLRHAAEHCGACPLAVPVIVIVSVFGSKRVVRCGSGAQCGIMWGPIGRITCTAPR